MNDRWTIVKAAIIMFVGIAIIGVIALIVGFIDFVDALEGSMEALHN